MTKLSNYRMLTSGFFSPSATVVLYSLVYETLTQASSDREKDWFFRLSLSTIAMVVPFLVALALAVRDPRHALFLSGKVGLTFAILSLDLAWKPVNNGMTRSKQSRPGFAKRGRAPFDTLDLLGKTQRLQDQEGKVVLVNIWATQCGPYPEELPELDRLYRERKDRGLIVFGLSDEEVDRQRKFGGQVPVSYPLLTLRGEFPNLYGDIAH